eukprot:449058-Pelagomonas_calceolata.AAC.2
MHTRAGAVPECVQLDVHGGPASGEVRPPAVGWAAAGAVHVRPAEPGPDAGGCAGRGGVAWGHPGARALGFNWHVWVLCSGPERGYGDALAIEVQDSA